MKTNIFVAIAIICVGNSYSADTQTGALLNKTKVTGEQKIISVSAGFQTDGKSGSGQVGGGNVTTDSIVIKNAKSGDVTNTATMEGKTTVLATGDVTIRSVSLDGGKYGNIINNPVRKSDLNVYAVGLSAKVGADGVSAELDGSVVIDSVCSKGNVRTGDITNAGTVEAKTMYFGKNVTANSVRLGNC